MPVNVVAPEALAGAHDRVGEQSDSPEHAPTSTRPPGGSAEARSSRSRRRGAMSAARHLTKRWKSGLRRSLNARTPSFDSSVS